MFPVSGRMAQHCGTSFSLKSPLLQKWLAFPKDGDRRNNAPCARLRTRGIMPTNARSTSGVGQPHLGYGRHLLGVQPVVEQIIEVLPADLFRQGDKVRGVGVAVFVAGGVGLQYA